jgi:hypothetical protein
MEWYNVRDQENDNNVSIVVDEENNEIVNNEIGDGNDNQDNMMDDDNNNKNLNGDGWVGQQLGEQLRTYVKQYREDLIALQQLCDNLSASPSMCLLRISILSTLCRRFYKSLF